MRSCRGGGSIETFIETIPAVLSIRLCSPVQLIGAAEKLQRWGIHPSDTQLMYNYTHLTRI